jgi:hypothetical protein
MTEEKQNLDVELKQWLSEEEEGAALTAVAERIGGFGVDAAVAPSPMRRSPRRALVRFAVAACLLLAGAAIGVYFAQSPGNSEMAWGDVVSAMQQVQRFHITAFGDDSGGPVKMFHVELYYQRPNHWRAQGMNYVQIGMKPTGEIYSVNDRKFVDFGPKVPLLVPSDLAVAVEHGDLLDATVGWLFGSNHPPGGQAVNDPSVRDAGIQVFDYHVQAPGDAIGGQSARIWVMERTRLPIRLEVTDSHSGAKTLVAFDYSDAEPDSFFDGDLFRRKIEEGGPPTTREAYDNHFAVDDTAAWYKLACNWTEPATDLKYSENPADAPAQGFLNRYWFFTPEQLQKIWAANNGRMPAVPPGTPQIRFGYFNLRPVDKLPMFYGQEPMSLLFSHERTSTAGVMRLLVIYSPAFEGTLLRLQSMQMNTYSRKDAPWQGNAVHVQMKDICAPGEIRLYAGQVDKKDASRFSIPFEARGRHGWIDGVYDPANGPVRLAIRKENP